MSTSEPGDLLEHGVLEEILILVIEVGLIERDLYTLGQDVCEGEGYANSRHDAWHIAILKVNIKS